MVRAVIFDLYGVMALNGWQAFKAKHFTLREDVWDQVFELGKQVDAGLANYDELVRFAAEQSGETEAAVRYQLEHTAANAELLDYAADVLRPHYKLGILSNAANDHVLTIFTRQQRRLFDAIVLSRHVGMVKPQRGMYLAVAEELGVQPETCLYVDDQERHVAGARDAGMHGILFTTVAQLRAELTDLS